MSAMEASIKWKERSGAQSAKGESKRANRRVACFPRTNRSRPPGDLRDEETFSVDWKGCRGGVRRPRAAKALFLPSIDQDAKRSRDRLSLRMGFFLGWGASGAEIGRGEKKIMRFRIETHAFGSVLGFDGLDFGELVRGILMENVDFACAGGDIQQLRFRLEDISVTNSRSACLLRPRPGPRS